MGCKGSRVQISALRPTKTEHCINTRWSYEWSHFLRSEGRKPGLLHLLLLWSELGQILAFANPHLYLAMATSRALFGTVPDKDYLGFWANDMLNAREVADFLDLDKRDVAKLAGVARASVRFDQKIPKEVLDRLQEIANICGLVAQFFVGDVAKTALWFKTVNPWLGNISPRDTIRYGRYEKLRRFVMSAMEENAASQRTKARGHAAESSAGAS
jgi:hypothetical protein